MGAIFLALSVLGMALGLGGAHVAVVLVLIPVNLLGAALVLAGGEPCRAPAASFVFFALAAYCALQALPLPLAALDALSPASAAVWSGALAPFHETLTWGALSLDPGASVLEASKWLAYGLTFWAATAIAMRYGRHVPALFVLGCAVSVALATLVHTLLGAQQVYGFYQPKFAAPRGTLGPLLNPNNLAGYLNLGAFCGLGVAWAGRAGRYTGLVQLGAALTLAMSVLSGSRAGVWILPAGILLFFALSWFKSEPRLALRAQALTFVVMGLGLVFALLGATSATRQQLSEEQLEKFNIVRQVWPLLGDYFAFGLGRGAFESGFAPYYTPNGSAIYSHPENWLVQWAAEWGTPVAMAALLGFTFALRRVPREILGSPLSAGAATGIIVLFVQNFADLGLELPATALAGACTLACLSRNRGSVAPGASAWRRAAPWIASAAGVCVWLLTLFVSRQSLALDRQALHQSCTPERGSAAADCVERLRAAMRRHPGEAYFPRLGAAVTLAAPAAAGFLQRALERNPNDARTHLLAAHFVQSRGVLHQALLELRLAASAAPELSEAVGRLAGTWSDSSDDLEGVAPPGHDGAVLLSAAARTLGDRGLSVVAELAFQAALARDPDHVPAHAGLAQLYVARIHAGGCVVIASCVAAVGVHADAMTRLAPDSAEAAQLKSRAHTAAGDAAAASRLLKEACPKLHGHELRSCLHERLELCKTDPTLGLDEVVAVGTEFAEQACLLADDCSSALVEIADVLAARGATLQALATYEKAAAQHLSQAALLGIARSAESLGRLKYAELSVERAARFVTSDQAAHDALIAWRDRLRRRALVIDAKERTPAASTPRAPLSP